MSNKAWKVVREMHGESLSCVYHSANECGYRTGRVPYKMNEWTEPHKKAQNQFLFVFKKREQAREFRRNQHSSELRIYQCEVKNPTTSRPGCATGGALFDTSVSWPKGTLFVDAVKLIKQSS